MTFAFAQAPSPMVSGVELIEAARLDAAEVVRRLASADSGLPADEAAVRLRDFGPNAIRSHGARPLEVLGRQLRNPLLILLAAATITSLIVGERTDAIIILAIVGLSVGLGFFNEYRSERVVEALHASIHHRTLVLREGAQVPVDVTEVVPGDVVMLRTGDLVPADLRLLDTRELECDEAVLTGEAMATTKRAEPEQQADLTGLGLRCIAYMGTTVRGGSARGVVLDRFAYCVRQDRNPARRAAAGNRLPTRAAQLLDLACTRDRIACGRHFRSERAARALDPSIGAVLSRDRGRAHAAATSRDRHGQPRFRGSKARTPARRGEAAGQHRRPREHRDPLHRQNRHSHRRPDQLPDGDRPGGRVQRRGVAARASLCVKRGPGSGSIRQCPG